MRKQPPSDARDGRLDAEVERPVPVPVLVVGMASIPVETAGDGHDLTGGGDDRVPGGKLPAAGSVQGAEEAQRVLAGGFAELHHLQPVAAVHGGEDVRVGVTE